MAKSTITVDLESDIEDKLFELVRASRIAEREVARAVNMRGDFGAIDDLSWVLWEVRRLASELNAVDPTGGVTLFKATGLMWQHWERHSNEPGDMEALESLQMITAVIAKLAIDLDVANGTAAIYDETWGRAAA
jgi:hypothetical protein